MNTPRELLRIPGVVRVGIGRKEVAGRVTTEWCYRVYVRDKRPLHALAASECVPLHIGGLATDVLVADDAALAGEPPPPLWPGRRIRRHASDLDTYPGTLGMLVKRAGKSFLLTCDHVLLADRSLLPDALAVYSPENKSCACLAPVAHVTAIQVPNFEEGDPNPDNRHHGLIPLNGLKYAVDAALAEIPAGVTGNNVIPNLGPLAAQTRDLSQPPDRPPFTILLNPDTEAHGPYRKVTTPSISVHKYGIATGLTHGQIVELSATRWDDSTMQVEDVWELAVTPGEHPYSEDFELAEGESVSKVVDRLKDKPITATPLGGQKVRLSGNLFCNHGDSGSILFDDDRKVVGIVTAVRGVDTKIKKDGKVVPVTLPNGLGAASFIRPVFSALGLTDDSILQPGTPLAGTAVSISHDRLLGKAPGLDALVVDARSSEAGRLFIELVMRHRDQVSHLIHERRRVKVLWHRHKGPAFQAAVLAALEHPQSTLPREIDGIDLAESLAKLQLVLAKEGDESLARDLDRYGDWMAALLLGARSLHELTRSFVRSSTP